MVHICQRIQGKNLLKALKKYLTMMELYTQSWGYHVPASLGNGYISHGDDKTIGLKATLLRASPA